ncbi:hypothetical protein HZA45_00540 [Candidatus Peregrinibacteria bacterium]|nr:hypothetical protein [Candidatus Peregrinibacteria bacterium]
MRRFPASLWFAFLICLVLAGVTAAAFAMLKPVAERTGDFTLVLQYAPYALGPLAGLLSFIAICILNGIRRLFRLRMIPYLHPVIVLAGIVPWLIFSWVLLDDPRYTPVAGVIMDFFARPLLWGSLTAFLLTILLSIPLFLPTKK